MNILAELRRRFAKGLHALSVDPAPYIEMVKPAQDARFGDFQANCAMPLAKRLKTNPRGLAAKIVEELDVADLCHPPEVAGPGFINLRLRDDWLLSETNRLISDPRLGVEGTKTRRTIVIDFSAPNIAKPMHVGHLRSTVIGDALYRVLKFLGHQVISDNHIGDWGTQFGMIIFGYKHFLDAERFRHDAVGELARLYRLVNQLAEYHELAQQIPQLHARMEERRKELESAEATLRAAPQAGKNGKRAKKEINKLRSELADLESQLVAAGRKRDAVDGDPQLKALARAHPDIAARARDETARLHAGDAENRRLWEQFVPECLQALRWMYERLDIRFDVTLGESFYQEMLADVTEELQARGIAEESQGAVCVFIEEGEAPFIIRKGDGAFTYATTDLATIKYRIDELEAEHILYVVDARQGEHFKLLFATARRWGFEETEFRHVRFGTILGDDRRPFKTRSGDTIGLESLLDESVARAREIVDANDDAKPDGPELDQAARADVAEAVGIGGIKYADLMHNRESDYVFSWEKMLAKTGQTATYIQYHYARICGIYRKGKVDRDALRRSSETILLTGPEERSLVLQLVRFPEALEDVVADYRPNVLTAYLFETANSFNTFYEKCPVLKESDQAVRTSRLLLCDLTARVLREGLGLLGIRACEQM